MNPDGILGVVPGSWPVKIIYEQKILNGDNTGPTALLPAQQCNTAWANYYNTNPFGTGVNDDITYLRPGDNDLTVFLRRLPHAEAEERPGRLPHDRSHPPSF